MVSLAQMKVNQVGIIKKLEDGAQFQAKMNSLNLRVGKKLKKISNSLLKGPIVVEIDNSRVAIGFGMAQRILVEVISEDSSDGKSKRR